MTENSLPVPTPETTFVTFDGFRVEHLQYIMNILRDHGHVTLVVTHRDERCVSILPMIQSVFSLLPQVQITLDKQQEK